MKEELQKTANWFEEWFNSPLYEKLYANRDEEEAKQLIDLLEKTLNLSGCSEILDLGCGRGRHAISLAQRGYRVSAIDLSEEAIKTAREKTKRMGLKIRFEVRDMRNPLPRKFDAIVNLFTTFGYFARDEENTRVLDSVTEMLDPGGMFVLDYMNSNKVKKTFQPTDHGRFRDISFKVHRYISRGSIIKDIEFSGGPIKGKKQYSERVKLYELDWFKKEFEKRNLQIDHLYGDYHGHRFDPESSPRLMIVSHLE
ncbi:SAM-dependent methyltransferase [Halalkalibaculum sp. DA384]|uniref:SAM-dependent methyltransferase n=1 Tax=Halalkalibaculum sp. DA384 TaxID=3373606 RepID=UPI00375431C9